MRRGGFLLVEMLMVLAIVGIVAGGLIQMFLSGNQTWQTQESSMLSTMELRRGIDALTREIASTQIADLTEIPSNGTWISGNLVFRIPEDGADVGTTVVNDATGVLEWSAPITISLGGTGGTQILRTQSGTTSVLANGVTALQFRRQAATPSIVEINVSVRKGTTTSNFPNSATIGTRVRVRN